MHWASQNLGGKCSATFSVEVIKIQELEQEMLKATNKMMQAL